MAVTQLRAERVLAQVKARFSGWLDEEHPEWGPQLFTDWDGAPYAIVWEAGPDSWAIAFTGDDSSEEERVLRAEAAEELGYEYKVPTIKPRKRVKGVYEEPIYSCVLGLYPD
jgi:hypothetical protein